MVRHPPRHPQPQGLTVTSRLGRLARRLRGPGEALTLRPGDDGPPTPRLVASTGRVVDVREAAAGRGLVLVFLPFASSPVCTREVRDLRDRHADLRAHGVEVVAVTCDALPALAAWVRAEDLPFPVLSDFWPHGAASSAWGVLDAATGAPRRTTFLVGARSVDDALGAVRDLLPPPAPGL
ncbi:redoxin domain-containing protein [Pseudokineococcus basanitobsidens]|uniref:Redoxin domain-containing protein n=1 Tax=Pseudokineococcus basanitobsidens TaxID=1926649 RepID=A0ABU8RKT5_9ACTN